jgi:hypothetical protein
MCLPAWTSCTVHTNNCCCPTCTSNYVIGLTYITYTSLFKFVFATWKHFLIKTLFLKTLTVLKYLGFWAMYSDFHILYDTQLRPAINEGAKFELLWQHFICPTLRDENYIHVSRSMLIFLQEVMAHFYSCTSKYCYSTLLNATSYTCIQCTVSWFPNYNWNVKICQTHMSYTARKYDWIFLPFPK